MATRLTVFLVSLLLVAPTLIFWLWLVILPAKVSMFCPEECWCDPGGYYVRCVGTSLAAVPNLPGIQVLRLSKNNITLLEKDSFISLTELDILGVVKCGLKSINLGAFNGLTKLTSLFIQRNDISELLPGTFENMSKLEKLFLNNNQLVQLDRGVFSGLVNLVYLYLEYNQLHYLHPDIFLELRNLQVLDLGRNTGLQVPTDRHFINSHSLSQLDISHCNVSSLSFQTFANVSALKSLDLSYNNLYTLDTDTFRTLPELSTLYLDHNPLHCDCQLKEVRRLFKDLNIRTVYVSLDGVRVPKCVTPREVEGIWWGVSAKAQCLDGKIQYSGEYRITSYSDTDIIVEKPYEYDVDFLRYYQVLVYVVPFIFGIAGNVILLIIIICNKDMRTVPNMYILNLAISDIISLTLPLLFASVNIISDTWHEIQITCKFFSFSRRMSVGLSAYCVAFYSFQRYRVTVNPFQVLASSPTTWRVTAATICGLWIVASLFAVPSALSMYLCEVVVSSLHITYYQRVVVFELLVCCVLPLCLIAFSYIMTARHLVVRSRAISEGTQNAQLQQTRRYTAKIVVGLTFVFLISYVPYHFFWAYFNWSEENLSLQFKRNLDKSYYKFQYAYLISTFCFLINSCLNPVALFCTSSPFRQHFKRYLTCFCKTNSPPSDLELAVRN